MGSLEALRTALPEVARDIRLNLQSVLQDGALSVEQRYGVAIASAIASRHQPLARALEQDALAAGLGEAVLEDARAAAVLMAMNNVYYRFRHVIGRPSYGEKPARLRMNRLARPASRRTDLELYCLAVSAINGCEACVRSHEQVVLDGGLGEDHVHDAVRIAATVHAAAVALEVGDAVRAVPQPVTVQA